MALGAVKWFNGTRSFGVIQPDDGSKNVFVHVSAVQSAGTHEFREGNKLQRGFQREGQGRMPAGNLKVA
ncbi:cold-shock protein [Muricoccus radiodurans]|uniref:cold-shock protein n=1 Tax=Muricoccus radiodurans TaxID=2231721 RepID=UPI003CEF4143